MTNEGVTNEILKKQQPVKKQILLPEKITANLGNNGLNQDHKPTAVERTEAYSGRKRNNEKNNLNFNQNHNEYSSHSNRYQNDSTFKNHTQKQNNNNLNINWRKKLNKHEYIVGYHHNIDTHRNDRKIPLSDTNNQYIQKNSANSFGHYNRNVPKTKFPPQSTIINHSQYTHTGGKQRTQQNHYTNESEQINNSRNNNNSTSLNGYPISYVNTNIQNKYHDKENSKQFFRSRKPQRMRQPISQEMSTYKNKRWDFGAHNENKRLLHRENNKFSNYRSNNKREQQNDYRNRFSYNNNTRETQIHRRLFYEEDFKPRSSKLNARYTNKF